MVCLWWGLCASELTRAEVILSETFEANGANCGALSYDNARYNGKDVSVGGSVKHSGNCAAFQQYQVPAGGDIDHRLNHLGAIVPNQTLHGVYWVRYHVGAAGWCRHQKMNRFYVNSNGIDAGSTHNIGVAHPYSYNGQMAVLAASGTNIADPAACCHCIGGQCSSGDASLCMTNDTPCDVCTRDNATTGCNCSVLRGGTYVVDTWVKVEFFMKRNNACTSSQTCAGCTDQFRLFIDGTLVAKRNNLNLGGNASETFRNFWIFGNASNDQNVNPCDETVYMDDICFDNGGECTGGVLSAPMNLTITAPSRAMAWVDNATGEGAYQLQASTDGGTTWSDSGSPLAANATSTGDPTGTGATKYRVVTRTSGADGMPSNVVDAPPGVIVGGGGVFRGVRFARVEVAH